MTSGADIIRRYSYVPIDVVEIIAKRLISEFMDRHGGCVVYVSH